MEEQDEEEEEEEEEQEQEQEHEEQKEEEEEAVEVAPPTSAVYSPAAVLLRRELGLEVKAGRYCFRGCSVDKNYANATPILRAEVSLSYGACALMILSMIHG